MSGLSDTSAFEAFDRMAEKIEESERRSIAAAEVDESLTGDTLEQEFQQLEAGEGEDVSNRLLALKKEMGFLPAGEEEDAKQLGAGDIQDADIESVEEEEESEAEGEEEEVPEAQLIEEFERLGRNTDRSK